MIQIMSTKTLSKMAVTQVIYLHKKKALGSIKESEYRELLQREIYNQLEYDYLNNEDLVVIDAELKFIGDINEAGEQTVLVKVEALQQDRYGDIQSDLTTRLVKLRVIYN